MRDIEAMLFGSLPDEDSPADRRRDDQWNGRAGRPAPAGDWCQTGPGEEALGWLAARLRETGGRGRHHCSLGKTEGES